MGGRRNSTSDDGNEGVMKIVDQLQLSRVKIGLSATTKPEIIRELLEIFVVEGVIKDLEAALAEFMEREAKGSTGIGNGIAIPHVRSEQVSDLVYLVAISKAGVDFESLDGEPIHIIVLMMAPKNSQGVHIKALARVSKILNDESTRFRLVNAPTAEEIMGVIAEREEELG